MEKLLGLRFGLLIFDVLVASDFTCNYMKMLGIAVVVMRALIAWPWIF